MKMIENIPVTDAVFGSSNAVESAPEWLVGTSYALDDIVQVAAAKRRYQSLVGSNTGNNPTAAGSTFWLDIGPTNPWAMFDEYSDTQTEREENITVVLNPPSRVSSIALFNLDAASVTITMTDPIEGIVYQETFTLTSAENVADYWDYFFAPILRKTDLFIDDLPPYAGASITLSVDHPDADAKIGKMIIGTMRDLGATILGAEFGRIDGTRFIEDEFNNITPIRRASRRRMSLSVIVPRENVDEVGRLLDDRRGLPTTFVGADEYTQTLIDGIVREWRIVIEQNVQSMLNIDVEGLR